MSSDRMCTFCAQVASFAPIEGLHACARCAKRVAMLARKPDAEGLEAIWASSGPPPPRTDERAVDEADVDAVFARFTEGIAAQISPDDAASHANLAAAYREMGLYVDARREAALALAFAADAALTEDSLRLLLTPPLLRAAGLAQLRRWLAAS